MPSQPKRELLIRAEYSLRHVDISRRIHCLISAIETAVQEGEDKGVSLPADIALGLSRLDELVRAWNDADDAHDTPACNNLSAEISAMSEIILLALLRYASPAVREHFGVDPGATIADARRRDRGTSQPPPTGDSTTDDLKHAENKARRDEAKAEIVRWR